MFNLTTLQKFAPLLGLLAKPAAELSDSDLSLVASAFSEDSSETATELFKLLREREGGVLVKNLLGTNTVKRLVAHVQENNAEVSNTIFCKCPICESSFEASIK